MYNRKTYIPVVPFGLNERSNPEGHIHAFLLNQPNEFHQIIVAFKVELQNSASLRPHKQIESRDEIRGFILLTIYLALLWLMSIPKHISLNNIQTSMSCSIKNG